MPNKPLVPEIVTTEAQELVAVPSLTSLVRAGPAAVSGRAHRPIPKVRAEAILAILRNSKSENTQKGYQTDWRIFTEWCLNAGLRALPADPAAVLDFLSEQGVGGLGFSGLSRRLAAINMMHELAGLPSPAKSEILKQYVSGLRSMAKAPKRKAAIDRELLYRFEDTLDVNTLSGKRDRAVLLVNWTGAFRRSEATKITVEDLEWFPNVENAEYVKIRLGVTKTNRDARNSWFTTIEANRSATSPRECPVWALREWLAASGIRAGYIFRGFKLNSKTELRDGYLTDDMVNLLVKQCALSLGLDARNYGAHSLRAGFVTQRSRDGADLKSIMEVTHHKRSDTVLGYIREANPLQGSAAKGAHGTPTTTALDPDEPPISEKIEAWEYEAAVAEAPTRLDGELLFRKRNAARIAAQNFKLNEIGSLPTAPTAQECQRVYTLKNIFRAHSATMRASCFNAALRLSLENSIASGAVVVERVVLPFIRLADVPAEEFRAYQLPEAHRWLCYLAAAWMRAQGATPLSGQPMYPRVKHGGGLRLFRADTGDPNQLLFAECGLTLASKVRSVLSVPGLRVLVAPYRWLLKPQPDFTPAFLFRRIAPDEAPKSENEKP